MALRPGGQNVLLFEAAPFQPVGAVGQVGFARAELALILDLYGAMVAAGEWRDYALDFSWDCATFAAFRRTADRPQMRLEKRPALRQRQGMWALYGEHGQILKRGHELAGVLAPLHRRRLKAIDR